MEETINAKMDMDPEIKAKWVVALRSGEYEQTPPNTPFLRLGNQYDALGVLGVITGHELDEEEGGRNFPIADVHALGVTERHIDFFVIANMMGIPFTEVASFIEERF